MSRRPDTKDYRQLFLDAVPLMDVRAPVEFGRGAFPQSVNRPLMTDEERRRVGLRYKEKGQEAAIALGEQLVSGDIKAQRIDTWVRFASENPRGYLYCFRGGLRSRIAQRWLSEAGIDYPLVMGGYKALRRFLIDWFEASVEGLDLYLVAGRTGSGKTRFLNRLPNSVDMEACANHRGSSFGRTLNPQPSQIDFENRLFIGLLKAHERGQGSIYLEDESHLIGRCALPQALRARMAAAPLLLLEQPMAARVQVILEDYVIDMSRGFSERDGAEAGFLNFREYLTGSLERVRKRLGGERYQSIRALMDEALAIQLNCGEVEAHRGWIERLLHDYYDPMYDYQLSRKPNPVLARGDFDSLAERAVELRGSGGSGMAPDASTLGAQH